MKKTLLISAISVAMACVPTFQASAIWPFGKTKAQEIAENTNKGTESLKAAAGKTKDAVADAVSATTDVVKDVKEAGNSFLSAVNGFMTIPAIQEHETMITCATAGGTAGFMAHYLRSKTRFSQEAKLNFARKILHRAKGFGRGAMLGIVAGMYVFEPQVQLKTANRRKV